LREEVIEIKDLEPIVTDNWASVQKVSRSSRKLKRDRPAQVESELVFDQRQDTLEPDVFEQEEQATMAEEAEQ
jgi:hypothetical protein